jgi:hypothetical protein
LAAVADRGRRRYGLVLGNCLELLRGDPVSALIALPDDVEAVLEGLQVWRRLRRPFPNATLAEVKPLLDEVLVP